MLKLLFIVQLEMFCCPVASMNANRECIYRGSFARQALVYNTKPYIYTLIEVTLLLPESVGGFRPLEMSERVSGL